MLHRGYELLARRPDPARILWLTLGVTYRCNGRCPMCSIWKRHQDHPELIHWDLQVEEYRRFLRSPFMDHLQVISLTGGEPFLRDDLVPIAEAAIELHPAAILSIASNGLLPDRIDRITGEILEREPRGLSISLSLDGGREMHNRSRGMADAYDRVMETVHRLQQYDVNIGFNFTITRENWRDLIEAFLASESLGIPLLVNFAHESTHYYGNPDLPQVPEDHLDEIHVQLQNIAESRQRSESLTWRILDPYPYFLNECVRHQRMKQQLVPCHSGTHSLYLDPQGTVYPCIILDRPLGNIRDQDFAELWTSARACGVRRSIAAGDCHCWVACEAVPSILRGLQSVAWNLGTFYGALRR
jgi:MoaA/NifB/PqqE/SkfB family radical SAM enzyme